MNNSKNSIIIRFVSKCGSVQIRSLQCLSSNAAKMWGINVLIFLDSHDARGVPCHFPEMMSFVDSRPITLCHVPRSIFSLRRLVLSRLKAGKEILLVKTISCKNLFYNRRILQMKQIAVRSLFNIKLFTKVKYH